MATHFGSSVSEDTHSTLVELLRRRASDQPDRCAYRFLLDGDKGDIVTISYAELDRQARAIGGRLQAAGAEGECVLLIYPPGLDYIAAFFGCLYAGAIAVPAYPPQLNRTRARLQAIAADARAKVVLTTASILSQVERSFAHTPELEKIEWLATDIANRGMEENWREPHVTSKTLAFLQYTSGSTGMPKGVMVSHGNLLHNSALMAHGFEYTPFTECVTWLPLYHDMGLIGGVLQPLYGGFPNTLMSPISFVRNPYSWLKAISTFKADLSGGPNFAYDLCARKISDEQRATLDLHNWKVAFTGAEPIRPETLERFVTAFASCGFQRRAFLPCYGLAEATLIVSCASPGDLPLIHAVERDALEKNRVMAAPFDAGDGDGGDDVLRLSGCGKPLPDQKVLVVSPESLTECRPDEVGEIWVSGPSVAQGYWHREKETEDTFHASLADTGEGPFLRTGDLGYLFNGELFVTGRLDDLIIIRGRNHYPQDIELTVEKSHAALLPNSGAAFLVEAFDEEPQLVIVHELDRRRQMEADSVIEAIRQAVAEDHGVQVYAVLLVRRGGVPKTSSGKIRRKACRAKFLEGHLDPIAEWRETAARRDAAPDFISSSQLDNREAIEAWLTTHLAVRLGVNPSEIDVNQPITRYGLDSLAAIELAHSLEKNVGVRLPMASFLESYSISQLVGQALAQFNGIPPLTTGALPLREVVTQHQLSHGQRALWFLYQLAPASPAYNIAVAARILSNVEPATLRCAFQELVNRHPSLRATFPSIHGEPVQQIHEHAEICFQTIDASTWSDAALNERLVEEAHTPFDLENGPVLRVSVFSRAEEEHILLLAVHHIVADFWSLVVLVKELSALYEAARLGSGVHLPPLNFQYADYARWQAEMLRGDEGERLWSYWKNQLKGKLPLLDLPTDRPRPVLQTYRGASLTSTLDAELTHQLKALSITHEATLYMTLLAAFQILLHRYTGQDELLVGSPTAGRSRAELAEVVGYFTNPVVLRADLSQDPTVEDFLHQVRQTVLDAFEHQDYPFALLVEQLQPERDSGRSPLFDVAFVFQKTQETANEISAFVLGEPGRSLEVGSLKFESVALEQRVAQFDVTLMAAEVGQEIIFSLQYNADLFEHETIERMSEHFRTLLAGIVSNPRQRLSQLPLLSRQERRQLLVEWNETQRSYPRAKCIHQLFEEQAERTPEALALVSAEERVSYRELNRRANHLAHQLRSSGVGPEALVGVCLRRSVEMVVGMLGVLKAGGAYVPLDPEYPLERLAWMLEDAGVKVVLTEEALSGLWSGNEALVLYVGSEAGGAEAAENPAAEVGEENLAYVIYTSGSTGRPKGVMIQHHSAVTFLHWAREIFTQDELSGVLASTSICFDLSIFEIFTPLSVGGKVLLAENALCLPALPASQEVTLVNTVPSAMSELVRMNSIPPCVRTVNLAGEPLSNALVQQVYQQSNVQKIFNLYGPSEDTTYSTYTLVNQGARGAPTIGRPIAMSEVYILDRHQQPVPVGVTGEIYIGGEGLARGYLNRPELTAERFIPHPFSTQAGARLYRTGDRGCYLSDGQIEFLGRADGQVKVRGYRIELGEVEAVLCQHKAVEAAVVVVREDVTGDRRLAAYVVMEAEASVTIDEVRQQLRERLPKHMIPSAFVRLNELPLTPNGKVDRAALPPPEQAEARIEVVAPRTSFEELLVNLYAEVLRLERVSINDNFFELGGHSLLATQLISRVREVFRLEVPLRLLFERPEVAALADGIERLLRSADSAMSAPPIGRASRGGRLPVSFAQQRLWFIDQLEAGSAFYNMPVTLRLTGELNIAALEQAFNEVIRRHEILRTIFTAIGGTPSQFIQPASPLPALSARDLSALTTEEREAEVGRLAREEAQRPFDLSRGPLLRVSVLRLGEKEHVLLLTLHHIISDGWSMGVLVREVAALYQAYAEGRPSPLAELPIQYADYAQWQREWLSGEVLENQLSYWRGQLGGELPVLELPTDHQRPNVQSYRGGQLSFTVSEDVTSQLKELSQRQGATLFMTLLSAFQLLLMRYSGQEDVIVGTPVAGRTRTELEGLIGFFVNTLVLRTDLSGDPTFAELVGRVREVCLGAYAHQDIPFEKLVEELAPERSLSQTPLFQVMFVLQNAPAERLRLPQVLIDSTVTPSETAKFDITLEISEVDEKLSVSISYNAELFELTTIERMGNHFQRLLAGIVSNPKERLSQLPLLSSEERHQLLVAWNQTQQPYPHHKCVHELYEEQAERTPEAVALVFGDEQLSYEMLNQRANQVAHRLRQMGVGPEVRVGICLRRSVEMVVGLLGVLKAGGAFVPLDAEYPEERLRWMIEDAAVQVVLTEERFVERLLKHSAQVICLDTERDSIAQESVCNPVSEATALSLAYVMYTSGSTGEPKGVSVVHRSVVRLVKETNYADLHAGEVFLQFAPITFDASTFEIWGCLLNGARLVIMPPHVPPLAELGEALRHYRITTLWLTAGLFHQMVDERLDDLRRVRQLLAGGDVLSVPHVHKFLRSAEHKRLINGYGPTENTTFTCCYEITAESEIRSSVPIGRPVSNTQVYILDRYLQPVPVGVVGEIYIGGDGLARDYLNRPALTAERFIAHPYGIDEGARLYRTGDRGRYLSDGRIEFLGRVDGQVKVRGYRVELGEVEAALRQHPAVQEAAAFIQEDEFDDKRIVACCVTKKEGTPSVSELRNFLQEKLPSFMIPSAFVMLDELPLTPNGKVDRAALPAFERAAEQSVSHVDPRTPVEELLTGIWSEVLKVPQVSIHDNFFELGGHSLLATKIVSRIREVFRVEVGLRALFSAPTVAGVAEHIEAALRDEQATQLSTIQSVRRDRPLPLSSAQQRLWFIDQIEPGNVAYNIPAAVRFRGRLDVRVLEQTLSEIIRRHEALRTTITIVDEQLVQLIAEPAPLSLPVIDLSGLPGSEGGAEAQRLAEEEAHRPFDIAHGPLIRVTLIRVSEEEHVLLCTMHHIIGDGWSILVLMRELKTLYEAFSSGNPAPLAGLSIQYADYAAWQSEWLQGEVLERQLAYWKRQLWGAPPILQLPTDKPRPARQTYSGESRTLLLPGELSGLLKELSRKESATLFMTLLAAFQLLLHRYTGQDDIVVGTPIAGRNRSELESLIGFFVNTLALRGDLSGDPSFRELLGRGREVSLGAYTHQELPFEKVLEELQPERSLGHTPLFQVFFNMLNLEFEKIELPGLTAEYLATTEIGSKFDLTLYVEELSDGISLRLVYNTDLFAEDRMRELLEQYRHLLWQIAREPDTKISCFSLITPAAQTVLPDPTETLDDGWLGSVHSLFSEHARRSPQALAVADKDDSWSYQELDLRSNQLAHYLLAQGIQPGDIVAIYAHRSASLVWALLGVLKAGAGFAILDPSYPDLRLLEYLRVAKPKELLVVSEAGTLPDELEGFLESYGSGRLNLPRRSVAAEVGFLNEYPSGHPGVVVGPDDLAYVSFTSGTTGKPKAILGRHGSLTHFLPWLKETFDLNESDAFSMLSGLSHDPLHRDVFTPLQLGGRICIPGPEVIETPGRLARWMKQERVSVAHLTPAMGRLLTEETAEGADGEVPSLRYAFFVGDVLTKRDVSLVQKLAPAVTCVNYYGSTETQRAVGCYIIPNEQTKISDDARSQRSLRKEVVPLGWGIRDVQLLVLNSAQQLAGIGEVGEIYLRSPHLALGYLGDEALSRERFIPNPFTQAIGDRLYKTGDLGRYLPDGSVEPLGRADQQVKIRGYRVELSEIEIALSMHPAISEVVVVAREDVVGDKQLVAYVVSEPHEAVGLSELREFTRRRLPDYMVPARFVLLGHLPLTPNGKVDRAALPAPEQIESIAGLVAPRTPVEELLAGMYTDLLNVPQVSVHDNFFELGGHSLLGIQLMSRVHRDFHVELPLRTLFESPTVAELALLVEQRKAALQPSGASVRTIQRRESKRVEELLVELEQGTVAGDEGDKEIPLTRG